MKNIAIIGFIGAIISLIIAVFCIIAYKSEANDEKSVSPKGKKTNS